jgi:hypothetical protein
VLRLLLNQPSALHDLPDNGRIASQILAVEARCALHSQRLAGVLADVDWSTAMADLVALERTLSWVSLSRGILRRASEPFGVPLRTLDAVHLASALALRRRGAITFATHDVRQSRAAAALGFEVIGVDPESP